MKMNRPYLIQRLNKPHPIENGEKSFLQRLGETFSFGGGLKNGGLSEKAMSLVSNIWSYDYMGAAEFEWGAVPKSLQTMAKNHKNLTTGDLEVTAKYRDWREKKTVTERGNVYYICLKDDEQEVIEWITKFADSIKMDYRTKEWVGLAQSVCKEEEKVVGWHDIDNHYMFFTDKEMFDKTKELFQKKKNKESMRTMKDSLITVVIYILMFGIISLPIYLDLDISLFAWSSACLILAFFAGVLNEILINVRNLNDNETN